MAQLAAHEVFEQHAFAYGHPGYPLPWPERLALIRDGKEIPVIHGGFGVITPPAIATGNCCHCGAPCDPKKNVRQHAVAGFEWVRHPKSNERLRFVVTHCPACLDSDACSRDETTPGSGVVDGPGGFCEAMPTEVSLGVSLFPGAQYLSRFLKLTAGAAGLYWLMNATTLFTSQGQQQADIGGPLANLIVPGDATAGHGFNAGALRILSGSAPGSGASQANAAETGTLGLAFTLAATAFGAATGATPSVTSANSLPISATIAASITAGYARLVTSTDGAGLSTSDRRFQLDVATSAASVVLNTTTLVVSGAGSLTALAITHGS